MSAIATLLTELESIAKILRGSTAKQIFSASLKTRLRDLATQYFSGVRSIAADGDGGSSALDGIFEEIHEASRKNSSTKRCIELLKSAKKSLIACETHSLSRRVGPKENVITLADSLIVSSLNEICPSASLAYQQALSDFAQPERLSWRGPATDLREALRETLDILAPDAEVESSPGFKLEQDAKHPTMKQKVRYVLRRRGVASGAMATPETAVLGVEEIVGGLTRSVYTRSSVSTHTATDRHEVVRVHAWVRLVLCELLELPL